MILRNKNKNKTKKALRIHSDSDSDSDISNPPLARLASCSNHSNYVGRTKKLTAQCINVIQTNSAAYDHRHQRTALGISSTGPYIEVFFDGDWEISSWVGDDQHIPSVVCFFFFFF